MTTRFVYSILRYVPDPARGEFVNIGLLAGSDETSEFDVRMGPAGSGRIRSIGGSLVEMNSYMLPMMSRVDAMWQQSEGTGHPPLSESNLRKLSLDRRSSIQVTRPLPILAESLAEALDRISDYVFIAATKRSVELTKNTMKARVRRSLKEHHLSTFCREMATVRVSGSKSKIDFAIGRDTATTLIQNFSFYQDDRRVLRDEYRSWAWFIGKLRQQGGEVEIPSGGSMKVPTTFRPVAILASPGDTDEEAEDLRHDATRVLEAEGAQVSDLAAIESVVAAAGAALD